MASPLNLNIFERTSTKVFHLLLAFVGTAWFLRVQQLFEQDCNFQLGDLSGFLLDAVVGFWIVALLMLVQVFFKTKPMQFLSWGFYCLLFLFWLAFQIGNDEHLRALGTMANLRLIGFLKEGVFVKGSVFALSNPGQVFTLFGLGLVLVSLACIKPWRKRSLKAWSLVSVALVFLTGLGVVLPTDEKLAGFRQTNFLVQNVQWLFQASPSQDAGANTEIYFGDLVEEYPPGKLRINPPRGKNNVLMIILEGISGSYLESASFMHGHQGTVHMPRLNHWAKQGLHYTSFVAQQRQTNRGEYALLCGDLPVLYTTTPKMTQLASKPKPMLPCLPELLRKAGYQTTYLQGAPLAFMRKDDFLPRIGFEQVWGDDWFSSAAMHGPWGVDDATLFEGALKQIDQWKEQEKPWLLTLLTVGTHHPYLVPKEFVATSSEDGFSRAVDYLDQALDRFLSELKEQRILENTLVVITSDESQGFRGNHDDLTSLLSQAWGLMIALLPGTPSQSVTDVYMQADVPISILDILGLDASSLPKGTTSLFREPPKSRMVPFANNKMMQMGMFLEQDKLITCNESFSSCSSYRLDPGRIFSANREKLALSESDKSLLLSVANASLNIPLLPEIPLSGFLLTTPKRILVPHKSDYIISGQYLSLSPLDSLEIEVEARLLGDNGSANIEHVLISNEPHQILFRKVHEVGAGQTSKVHYRYNTLKQLRHVNCGLRVVDSQGKNLELEVLRAKYRLVKESDALSSEGGSGLKVWVDLIAPAQGKD